MTRRRARQTLAALGEFGFLKTILPGLAGGGDVLVGPGQDCAVVGAGTKRWLLTVDSLVEGVHFRPDWLTPSALGRRSYAVNASDIAAMGGAPRFALVNLAVPPNYPVRSLRQLQSGIVRAAAADGAAVVGGNLTRADQLAVTIALVGECGRRWSTRQGARPGDHVFVTGTLGDAALAVCRLLRGEAVPPSLLQRYRSPQARVQAGGLLVRSGVVSAMIDVSDGLVQDLGHLCEQSRVGVRVEAERVPRSAAARRLAAPLALALCGGEDYELLCTVAPKHLRRLQQLAPSLGCPITEIGRVVRGRGTRIVDSAGRLVEVRLGGYDHFASGR